jgi:hypothetical protein
MQLSSVSSFSSRLDVANRFGEITVAVQVPRAQIFATARTGIGDTSEDEWLVLGGTTPIRATVIRASPFIKVAA